MENKFIVIIACLLIVLLAVILQGSMKIQNKKMLDYNEDPYEKEWKEIDKLEAEGLPKSALEKTLILYDRARKDNNPAQIIKTLLYRGKYQAQLEEDGLVKAIYEFQEQAEKESFPVNAILHSMTAEMYQKYLSQNYWKFNNRTTTVGLENSDIRTWTPDQLSKKSVELYNLSIQNSELKQIPLTEFKEITTNSDDNLYYPTLFDFLVKRALKHFSNEQTYLTQPAYKFYIDQEEALAPLKTFLNTTFESQDEYSQKFMALLKYQEWLAFRKEDKDPNILIYADLERLKFVHQNSVHPDKTKQFRSALEALLNKHKAHPQSATVAYELAQVHRANGNKYKPGSEENKWEHKTAYQVCEEAIKRHPQSDGAKYCKHLQQQITQKEIQIYTEKVIATNESSLFNISYKNVDKFHFKIVKLSLEQYIDIQRSRKRNDRIIAEVTRATPIRNWTINLPSDGDYQTHTTETMTASLPPGKYALVASSHPDYKIEGHAIAYAFYDVSDLAFLVERDDYNNQKAFVVTDRTSGKPLSGITTEFYIRVYNSKSRAYDFVMDGKATSDKDGKVNAISSSNDNFVVKFINGKDVLFLDDNYYAGRYRYQNTARRQTTFFTDRAIYRPGQTIYFKGIVQNIDENGMPSLVTSGIEKVTFYDVNYQEVESVDLSINEYGTFHGSFTAPSSGLLGSMTLQSSLGNGRKSFRVEEYKRPKFEVDFKPVTEGYRLDETVTVTGFAKAYAGNNIDGAKVSYTVIRQVRFPYWCWWRWGWYNPFQRADVVMTHGFTKTDENGEFTIAFEAMPDPSIPKDKNPLFTYQVKADVVDITGETHSGDVSVRVGYVALEADIDINESLDKQEEHTLKLITRNLNGEFERAQGTVVIQQLNAPEELYKERYWEQPDLPIIKKPDFEKAFPDLAYADESDISKWEVGKTVLNESFDSEQKKSIELKNINWETGHYKVTLTTKDKYGTPVEIVKYTHLFDLKEKTVSGNELYWHDANRSTAEPGETVTVYFGSAYKEAWFLYQVFHNKKVVQSEWIKTNKLESRSIKIEEKHRGGLGYSISMVHNNRPYCFKYPIDVPWSNKELKFEYATFRDKLLPGADEEWTLKLIGPKGDKVMAEMLGSMYDASLDAFAVNTWNGIHPFPVNYIGNVNLSGNNNFRTISAQSIGRNWNARSIRLPHHSFPQFNWFGFVFYEYAYADTGMGGRGRPRMSKKSAPMPQSAPMMTEGAPGMEMDAMAVEKERGISNSMDADDSAILEERAETSTTEKEKEDFSDVKVRTNLNETVFFYPDLRTDKDGNILIKFKMNEALTRWKFMGFAHTTDMKYGFTEKEIVTQKDLMVTPNPPRFLREFDNIHFTAKVSNLSEGDLSGTAVLQLFDALTMQPIDDKLGNSQSEIAFTTKQGQSAPLSWKLDIPQGLQAVTYRVIAKAGSFSDGEENSLPVLTNRMLVTEAMPLPIRGNQTKQFTFKAMEKASASKSLAHHRYTLEFTSNPAWYAVQALPYLMEYPHQCTEQIFSRYYANSLATSVANSHPKIMRVFDQWKNTDALLSNLSKNQELKNVLLEETPWVLDAQNEEKQKKQIGLLFDLNRMSNEQDKALQQLKERQLSNGGFAWFPGGRDSWYITQHLVEGFGHLDRLGVKSLQNDPETQQVMNQSVRYIDDRLAEYYEELKRRRGFKPGDNHLSQLTIHYLYARSFFLNVTVNGKSKAAHDYFLGQAKKYYLDNGIYLQGMIALALHRYDDPVTPQKIVNSLRENSLNSEEMGMYWKYNTGYYWYQLPIETHAMMIEVFDEVGKDAKAVNDLKVWLLKNKQTNNWKTTKATTSAVYAMLMNGDNWLLEDKPVEIKLAGKKVDQSKLKTEAGTGYFKTSWDAGEITNSMSSVEVKNPNSVVAWGAVYWQYFEDLDKIQQFEDTPVKINKNVFRVANTDRGEEITPVTESSKLEPGDKLTVRIEIRVDRDLEYVHMKDMRASGFEPMNVLSQYKWQGGLGYYESTKDASTNFFMDHLPKGTYVFEYPLRVNHKGDFSNGITTLQCMYAPEFTSHSEGIRITVE